MREAQINSVGSTAFALYYVLNAPPLHSFSSLLMECSADQVLRNGEMHFNALNIDGTLACAWVVPNWCRFSTTCALFGQHFFYLLEGRNEGWCGGAVQLAVRALCGSIPKCSFLHQPIPSARLC